MRRKAIWILKSERGDSNYISTSIYILIAVILIAFIINVFQIITVKQQMDHAADQIVKQVQLNGCANKETESLFTFLKTKMKGANNVKYAVDSSEEIHRIQIGTPFYVTVTGDCYLGGFWKIKLAKISIEARGAGVSEHYWKD